jgi:pyruvate dehydrogenase E2 component (dihydrolipoamide acetyltransferase)
MIVASDVGRAAQAAPSTQASPVARRIAEGASLDLTGVSGTGPRGRIMRQDVERALEQQDLQQAPDTLAAPVGPEALSGLRAIIAQRLTASWRERPHVTVTTEADATNLVAARQQATAELERKVSYDAFLVALVARALREHPAVSVRLTAAGLEQLSEINIGVAVDTERGLLVPVVRDAATKNLAQIQHTLQELVERTLSGKSLPDDLVGGTFTITNLGMFEIDAFTPIINPPESAILGVGRIVNKPVGLEGQIVLRDMMTLSLSFDHRLIDGAPAARFLQRIKQLIERPFALAL